MRASGPARWHPFIGHDGTREVDERAPTREQLLAIEEQARARYRAVASPPLGVFIEVMDFQLAEWLQELRCALAHAESARERFDREHATGADGT